MFRRKITGKKIGFKKGGCIQPAMKKNKKSVTELANEAIAVLQKLYFEEGKLYPPAVINLANYLREKNELNQAHSLYGNNGEIPL